MRQKVLFRYFTDIFFFQDVSGGCTSRQEKRYNMLRELCCLLQVSKTVDLWGGGGGVVYIYIYVCIWP